MEAIVIELRRCFFPHWDKKGEWRIIAKDDEIHTVQGRCTRETKTIEVCSTIVEEAGDELRKLICHEICHAVASCSHGKIWQTRYLKVASKAADTGELVLAENIRSEVKFYQEAPILTVHTIRCEINDAAMDQPNCSLDVVIQWVANNHGMTPVELLKRYPSSTKVFYEAKELVASMKRTRDAYEAK